MQDPVIDNPVLIEKESIPELSFLIKDVVKQQDGLFEKLMEATTLGNLHRGKVSIFFRDDVGLKVVKTTVWCTGKDYICLKGGVWLPINRIHKIEF